MRTAWGRSSGAEQGPFKPRVVGSNPTGLTISPHPFPTPTEVAGGLLESTLIALSRRMVYYTPVLTMMHLADITFACLLLHTA